MILSSPSRVQIISTGSASAASLTQAYTSAQTAGNANIVQIRVGDQTSTCKVTDSIGNQYTKVADYLNTTNSRRIQFWIATNIKAAGASGNTVTATYSAANSCELTPMEYSNVDYFDAFDSFGTGQGTGTLITLTPVGLHSLNQTIVAYMANVSLVPTVIAPYTNAFTTNKTNLMCDATFSAVGQNTPTANCTNASWYGLAISIASLGSRSTMRSRFLPRGF